MAACIDVYAGVEQPVTLSLPEWLLTMMEPVGGGVSPSAGAAVGPTATTAATRVPAPTTPRARPNGLLVSERLLNRASAPFRFTEAPPAPPLIAPGPADLVRTLLPDRDSH